MEQQRCSATAFFLQEAVDPFQRFASSSDSLGGCKGRFWEGQYGGNSSLLSVKVGPTKSTIVVSEAIAATMEKDDTHLLKKMNGTRYNDELTEILCDFRRSNPWNIEMSDKACHFWSQTRCKALCSEPKELEEKLEQED